MKEVIESRNRSGQGRNSMTKPDSSKCSSMRIPGDSVRPIIDIGDAASTLPTANWPTSPRESGHPMRLRPRA